MDQSMDQSVSQVVEISESDETGDGFWEFDQFGEDDADKPTVYPPGEVTGFEVAFYVLNNIGTRDGLYLHANGRGGCEVSLHSDGAGQGDRGYVHELVAALGLTQAPGWVRTLTREDGSYFRIAEWNPSVYSTGRHVQLVWYTDPEPPF